MDAGSLSIHGKAHMEIFESPPSLSDDGEGHTTIVSHVSAVDVPFHEDSGKVDKTYACRILSRLPMPRRGEMTIFRVVGFDMRSNYVAGTVEASLTRRFQFEDAMNGLEALAGK